MFESGSQHVFERATGCNNYFDVHVPENAKLGRNVPTSSCLVHKILTPFKSNVKSFIVIDEKISWWYETKITHYPEMIKSC